MKEHTLSMEELSFSVHTKKVSVDGVHGGDPHHASPAQVVASTVMLNVHAAQIS
jgi:hypothetical protein